MNSLPLLLSVPHGGGSLPRELAPRVALSSTELFFESDPLTHDIFAMGDFVQGRIVAEISRVIVDMDIDPFDRPPEFESGVVKYKTKGGKPVWLEDEMPTEDEIERLLDRYHRPYHDVLERTANRGAVQIGIDCHSMAPVGLKGAVDEGEPRPLFSIANFGDKKGKGDDTTCPFKLMTAMKKAIETEFSEEDAPEGVPLVAMNSPFEGGYILERHGFERTPWIQLHMNQHLYLPEDRTRVPESDREGIAKLRHRMFLVFLRFCEQVL